MAATRIMVVADGEGVGEDLGKLLQRMGYETVRVASTADDVCRRARDCRPDLVLVDLGMDPDRATAVLVNISQQHIAATVAIGSPNDRTLTQRITRSGVMAYLLRPVGEENLRPAIEIALSRFRELEALARETNDLREQLEALQLVEQAKKVLMTQYNLSEAEASRRILKASADIPRPMGAIAEAILHTSSAEVIAG